MESKNHSTRMTRPLRGLLLGVVAMTVSQLVGCAASTTYSFDEGTPVTEAIANRDLGIDYLSSKRTAMAIRELETSLEMDADDPMTHLWLGEAYRRKGRMDKAEAFLVDAVKLATRRKERRVEQEARLNLSALYSQMGRYEEAIEHCDVLSVDATLSTPWRPLTNCGWALFKLDRLGEARERFSDALDFYPSYGPALLNLGILEAKEGHRMAAIARLDKALASGRLGASGHAEANFRLGELYVALGHRDKAIAHFQQAAKIAPDADWGSQSQAYLDLLR